MDRTTVAPAGARLKAFAARSGVLSTTWGPVAGVVLAAALIWIVSGVGVVDVAIFVAFEALALALPGCLVYAALAPGDGPVRTLAFGWALGHVIAMLAYLAAVTSGHPGLFVAYPFVAAAAALPLLLRNRSRGVPLLVREPIDPVWAWGVAGAAVLGVAWFALGLFPSTPLPGAVESASYLRDVVFQLSATAEVRNHWPLTDPKVAGVSVAYHTFPYMYMAGIDQITGLGLPLVVFRLATVPLIVLFVLQLGAAARVLTGRRWVGPVAALLFLFVSEVDLDSTNDTLLGYMPFYGGGPFIGLELSPTYAAGLIFFVPAVVLLAELLGLVEGARWSPGKWIVLGLLLVGCAGSKAMILPVLLGGLVVYAGLRALVERRLDRRALLAVVAVGAVFLFFFVTLYRGAGLSETGAALGVGGSTRWTFLLALFELHVGHVARYPGVVLSVLLLLTAPLIGLLWFVRRGRSELRWRHGFLLAILLAGLGPFVLLEQPFGNDLFFISYGLAAASLVSAEGLVRLWQSERVDRRRTRLIAAYGVAIMAALIVLWRVTHALLVSDRWTLTRRFVVTQLSWLVFVALVVVGLIVAARASASVRPVLMRLVVVTVLAATALNIPIDVVPELRTRVAAGQPLHRVGEVTPSAYEGLVWVRDNTDVDDVLAVNRQTSDAYLPWTNGHPNSPDYFYATAFAERRVFYEGTVYTAESFRLGVAEVEQGLLVAYPERKQLNDGVFERGDPEALATMYRRYGVRYLVWDKRAAAPPRYIVFRTADTNVIPITLPRVFSNATIDVYAVPPPATW